MTRTMYVFRILPWPNARDIAGMLLQLFRQLLRIDLHVRVEEREQDDQQHFQHR